MAINWGGVAGMIVFYLLILAVGMWASRKSKGSREQEQVMLAGRNIGLLLGVFTMTATWVGGGYINGTAESIFTTSGTSGLVWTQATWGYSTSLMLGGLFFAKKLRSKGYMTMLDPFQHKYGNRMCGLLFIPALTGDVLYTAAILNALGSTVSVVLDLDMTLSVIVSACIAVFYTFFGGLYSVAYTDVIQLICMFFGLWICVPFAMTNEAVEPIESTSQEWLGTMKPNQVGLWIDYALLVICGGIPWQEYFQRVLSSRTPQTAQTVSVIAGFGCLIMGIPSVLLGAVGASTNWNDTTLNIDRFDPYSQTSLILPLVIQHLTPPVISFIGLGAVSAAVMSSIDSTILSASSMFTHNVYKQLFRPKASNVELLWVMRAGIVMAGVISTAIGLSINSVYKLFVFCSDFVYVVLFPQLVCVVYFSKCNTYGSLLAYVVALILRFGGGDQLLGIPALIKYPYYDEEQDTQLFPYKTLAMLSSLVTLLVVSYLLDYLFRKGTIPKRYDVFRCVANLPPAKDQVDSDEDDEVRYELKRRDSMDSLAQENQ